MIGVLGFTKSSLARSAPIPSTPKNPRPIAHFTSQQLFDAAVEGFPAQISTLDYSISFPENRAVNAVGLGEVESQQRWRVEALEEKGWASIGSARLVEWCSLAAVVLI